MNTYKITTHLSPSNSHVNVIVHENDTEILRLCSTPDHVAEMFQKAQDHISTRKEILARLEALLELCDPNSP